MESNTKTVLACDDEPLILESVSYVVNKEGYNLLTAENGTEAIELARKHTPDLMLLDMNMPDMTGLEVCKQIKADETTKKICIVMLTANAQSSHVSEAYEAGADHFIPKPFSPRDLKTKLHELLD